MNLFKRQLKEENENLAEKIIKTIEKTKKELKPYVETYAISKWQDAVKIIITEKEIHEIISNEKLIDEYIEGADIDDADALEINLKFTKTSSNLKADIENFFFNATKSAISNLKRIKLFIREENYVSALECLIKANKALGCLEAAEKLGLTRKLFSAEIQKKVDAARAIHPFTPAVKSIVLTMAEKQQASFRSRRELFDLINNACHFEIKKQLGQEAIKWDELNFTRTFMNHAKLDKEFGEGIDLLIKRRNDSAHLLSTAWSNVKVER